MILFVFRRKYFKFDITTDWPPPARSVWTPSLCQSKWWPRSWPGLPGERSGTARAGEILAWRWRVDGEDGGGEVPATRPDQTLKHWGSIFPQLLSEHHMVVFIFNYTFQTGLIIKQGISRTNGLQCFYVLPPTIPHSRREILTPYLLLSFSLDWKVSVLTCPLHSWLSTLALSSKT